MAKILAIEFDDRWQVREKDRPPPASLGIAVCAGTRPRLTLITIFGARRHGKSVDRSPAPDRVERSTLVQLSDKKSLKSLYNSDSKRLAFGLKKLAVLPIKRM
jgi:hypothetical protein